MVLKNKAPNTFFFIAVFASCSFIAGIAGIPKETSAFTYSKTIASDSEKILFRFGGIEAPPYFLCKPATLSCTNLGTTTPSEDVVSKKAVRSLGALSKEDRYTKVTFSSSGRYIAYYKYAKGGIREFKLRDTRTGGVWSQKGSVAFWDLLIEESKLFAFDPAETRLVYLDDRNGYPSLYSVSLKNITPQGMRGTQLMTKPYSVADFILWDSNSLFFVANREHPLLWSLYKYSFDTTRVTKIADNVSYSQPMEIISGKLIFSQIVNTGEIPALYSPEKGIEYFGDLAVPDKKIIEEDIARRTITSAGLRGVILRPPHYDPAKKYPIIIWLHGGPYRQTSVERHSYMSYGSYDWMLDQAVENGTLVIKLDYRGSYGYGRAFAESIKNNVGKGDTQDVLKAVKSIRDKIPNSGVYLVGNSYGGYLALRTIVEDPSLFAGAISINGVTDWKKLLGDLRTSIFNVHFGGAPSKSNAQLYNQASIISRIGTLDDQKIILVHGEKDMTVPASQSKLLHEALVGKKKQSELVIYEGEDHVFAKESSMEDLCRRLLTAISSESFATGTPRCVLK